MKRRQYLVEQVHKKSTWMKKPIDAAKLQEILNEKGAQGWIFDKALDGETILERETFLLIFYKEMD